MEKIRRGMKNMKRMRTKKYRIRKISRNRRNKLI